MASAWRVERVVGARPRCKEGALMEITVDCTINIEAQPSSDLRKLRAEIDRVLLAREVRVAPDDANVRESVIDHVIGVR